MNALLLNLDRHPERLDFFSAQANRARLAFRRLPAVDASTLPGEFIARFRADRPLALWTLGEIGCVLSHLAALEIIALSDAEFGVVFEDDVHLSDHTTTILEDLSWIPASADLIRLEAAPFSIRVAGVLPLQDGFSLGKLQSEAWGAAGYLIRRSAARFIVAMPDRLNCVADKLLYERKSGRLASILETYQLMPAICVQDKFLNSEMRRGLGSSIEHARTKFERGAFRSAIGLVARTLRRRTMVKFR